MLAQLAQINLGDAFKLKDNQGIGSVSAFDSFRSFISSILPNAFVIAGIILLILLVGGGVTMIANSGNPEARQKSRGAITAAILGFIIILAAYWIIQILQVVTGVSILSD